MVPYLRLFFIIGGYRRRHPHGHELWRDTHIIIFCCVAVVGLAQLEAGRIENRESLLRRQSRDGRRNWYYFPPFKAAIPTNSYELQQGLSH